MSSLPANVKLLFVGNHPNGLGSEGIISTQHCRPVILKQMRAAFPGMTEAQVLQCTDSAACINVSESGDLSEEWLRHDSAKMLLAIGEAALAAGARQETLAVMCYGMCPELLRQLELDPERMFDPGYMSTRNMLIKLGAQHTTKDDVAGNPLTRATYSRLVLRGEATAAIQVSDGSRSAAATAGWYSHPNYIEGSAADAFIEFPQKLWRDLAAGRARMHALSIDCVALRKLIKKLKPKGKPVDGKAVAKANAAKSTLGSAHRERVTQGCCMYINVIQLTINSLYLHPDRVFAPLYPIHSLPRALSSP